MSQDSAKCPFHAPRFPDALRDVENDSLDGNTDLTVWAPIKEGFIDSFGNVTYESRLRIVAEALNKLRKNVREFQLVEPFPDSTKKILSLLSFRIGITDRDLFGYGRSENKGSPEDTAGETLRPRKYMYLTATFDGPWEPYMRQIWYPLGTFLDLVLCNCDGYKPAYSTGYEDYIQWVRDHLLDTAMFYAVSGLTVKDNFYLEQLERTQREEFDLYKRDLEIAHLHTKTVEQNAEEARQKEPVETLILGLEALNVLYQLTRYYPPDKTKKGDGIFLHQATRDILADINLSSILETYIKGSSGPQKTVYQGIKTQFKDQLAWYDYPYPRDTRFKQRNNEKYEDFVQRGILSPYVKNKEHPPVTHGALLMLRITDPKKVAKYLNPDFWSWENSKKTDGYFFRNIAISNEGMKKLPLTEKELRDFPKEFRQGARERAPTLGDNHFNHPQRWNLPPRNWPDSDGSKRPPVSTTEIDLYVQLRVIPTQNKFQDFKVEYESFETQSLTALKNLIASISVNGFDSKSDKTIHLVGQLEKLFEPSTSEIDFIEIIPTYIALIELLKDYLGVEVLSIQSTYRPEVNNNKIDGFNGPPTPKDHFGFRDGISQPKIENLDFENQTSIEDSHPMAISKGDLLRGHENLLGDYVNKKTNNPIHMHGSFVAFRKMKQNIGELQHFLNACSMADDKLTGFMMGRKRNGDPLLKEPAGDNSFRYDHDIHGDKNGTQCPFISHVRRANPRDIVHKRKSPKILRRGMTYGKKVPLSELKDLSDRELLNLDKEDRGVMFIAYCANLSEQYETVLRWVNGGNSTNVGSMQFDPILAPLPKDGDSVFRFADKTGDIHRFERRTQPIMLDGEKYPAKSFVELEWSAYAFAPAKGMLTEVISRIKNETDLADGDLIDYDERGRQVLEEIENLPSDALKRREWKILLEDWLTKDSTYHNISGDVWAYIRNKKEGVYPINSGIEGISEEVGQERVILAVSRDKVERVLNDHENFSVGEIGRRISEVFAPNQIGMDPGTTYYRESSDTNAILYEYSEISAFKDAYSAAKGVLDKRKQAATILKRDVFKIELVREFFAPALANICHKWFGILDKNIFIPGPWAWDDISPDDRKPRCPGDFFAPSRGAFYPRPTPAIYDYALNHGARLKTGIDALMKQWDSAQDVKGVISKEMWLAIHKNPEVKNKKDLLGRNIIGAMIGMLPPTEASLRGTMVDWLDNHELWKLQGQLKGSISSSHSIENLFGASKDILFDPVIRSIARRPAPDLLYRIAKKDINLSSTVKVKKGDTVIVSLVSAMMGEQIKGVTPPNDYLKVVFGGERAAGPKNPGANPHACPAKKMATGAIMGILAALLNSGTIQALPASLILEISDWE